MPTIDVSFDEKTKDIINKIESAISTIGDSRLYFVGGFVRDCVLGIPYKDIDFVVCGMPFDSEHVDDALSAIEQALNKIPLARVKEVGKSFGIVKATIDGEEFDFALPRISESKVGTSHTAFVVVLDPSEKIEIDLSRRDFTMNAMAMTTDFELIDPFNGEEAIKNGLIETVGGPHSRFSEDPLRILRGMQFASRFDFKIEEKTLKAMSDYAHLIAYVSGERIYEEIKKAFSKNIKENNFVTNFLSGDIGKEIFGKDIKPISLKLPVNDEDKVTANMVALFLRGGNYEAIKPPTDLINLIELGRNILSMGITKKEPWEFIGILKPMLHIFRSFMVDHDELISKMMSTPLTTKELALSGGELMEMGFKGKEIGIIQKKFLSALWNSKISNEKSDLVAFLSTV